ncbi:MAG: hypothetical protein ACRD3L_15895 [Terriglobales bacterium]
MNDAQEAPIARVAEALVSVTSAAGLQPVQVLVLLMAGLKVDDLLIYAEAVALNRLN